MLQIPVHGDHDVAAGEIESRRKPPGLPEISAQPHQVHAGIMLVDVTKNCECVIAAAIVDENQLIGFAERIHHFCQFQIQGGYVFLFVEERDNNRIANG